MGDGRMLKFKMVGITFNMAIPFAALFAFVGMMVIGGGFYLEEMGWWCIPYGIFTLLYMAAQPSIANIITKAMADDTITTTTTKGSSI